jgi:hypothetical protein
MNARTPRWLALLGMLALMAGGAGLALAQGQAKPAPASEPGTLADVTRRIADLNKSIEAALYESSKVETWITLGEAREAELRAGRRVAVGEGSRTVFMDRAVLNQSLLRHVTQSIIDEAASEGDNDLLGLAADAGLLKEMVRELERDALEKSEEYRRALTGELDAQRARLSSVFARRARLAREVAPLEDLEAELERAEVARGGVLPQEAARQSARSSYDLQYAKQVLGERLESARKAQNWSADHHFQVGMLIGYARTFQELALTSTLMREYAGCYETMNLRRAAVLANARTGMYKTPGERIAELDKIGRTFNECTGKAAADFHRARGR